MRALQLAVLRVSLYRFGMSENMPLVARLDPSPIRRWTAVLIVAGVGIALLYLAAANPFGDFTATLMVLGLGAVALWIAYFIHKSSSKAILLTEAGLSLEGGRTLADFENIDGVDRSVMAFKPSNGFVVKLKRPGLKGWAPGIWWCVGRNLGIGGATSRDQARNMADALALMLAEARSELPQGKLR